ncbi:hypothetical protein FQA39_LY19214 [Lamprigera yunnana]|nr:hypothetical protein FQA39_LY19214 [Lamprigera yunnana]
MPKNTDHVILQLYARTPAPCRDYCGLTVTNDEIVLNVWNITNGPHVYPKRLKCAVEDLEDERCLNFEINRVFGSHVSEFITRLSKNELNLQHCPTKAFLTLLKYVAAKDIMTLSQTSKIMFEVMFKTGCLQP